MNYFSIIIFLRLIFASSGRECNIVCPVLDGKIQCGLDLGNTTYKMFPNKCTIAAYAECHQVDMVQVPIKYCIKYVQTSSRKMYGQSCPVFCPNHYRPVCAANKLRSYVYRTFTNGCYLDMLNCRGDNDFASYIEVPLQYCPKHAMKNIFKEQVVVSNLPDYADY